MIDGEEVKKFPIFSIYSVFDTAVEKGKVSSFAGGYINAEFVESEIEEKAIIEYAAEFSWEVVFCISAIGRKCIFVEPAIES